MYFFNLEKMTQRALEEKIEGILQTGGAFEDEYDQYIWYMEIGEKLKMYGCHYPKDCFEEQTLRSEFINSLS